ncbi:MAG: carbohydrate ABC transporter permease [Clostridia bacterium]|nr:carbohydrate ABC transporter permease [Clostridia bacterium]
MKQSTGKKLFGKKLFGRNVIKQRTVFQNVFLYTLCVFFIIYSFTLLYPIYWTVINSLKTPREFIRNLYGFPKVVVWGNFSHAFEISVKGNGIAMMTLNNILTTVPSLFMILLSSSLAAYTLTKYSFKGSGIIYNFVLVVGMLPFSGSIPSLYNFFKATGLYNTHLGIILLNSGGFGYPFLLLYNYYLGVSWTYAEAAQMDGASDYQVFFRVMLPQSVPMLVAILIMIFMGVWGDFTNIYLYMPSHPTLAVGMKLLSDNMQSSGDWTAMFAAMLITTVPIGILYVWANRQFFKMRVETGIKG